MLEVNSFHKMKLKYIHKVNKVDVIKGVNKTDSTIETKSIKWPIIKGSIYPKKTLKVV